MGRALGFPKPNQRKVKHEMEAEGFWGLRTESFVELIRNSDAT